MDRRIAVMVNVVLRMAIEGGRLKAGTMVRSDHGSQPTPLTFNQRVRKARLSSLVTVGYAFDNTADQTGCRRSSRPKRLELPFEAAIPHDLPPAREPAKAHDS